MSEWIESNANKLQGEGYNGGAVICIYNQRDTGVALAFYNAANHRGILEGTSRCLVSSNYNRCVIATENAEDNAKLRMGIANIKKLIYAEGIDGKNIKSLTFE